jgi:sugar O-acyltransferase (sialic acid O-acetyltransferase NeuD family)
LEKKVCIFGTGGFAREVFCCLIDSWRSKNKAIEDQVVFMEDDDRLTEVVIMGIPVIPKSQFDPTVYDLVIGISDPKIRKKIVAEFPANTPYTTIIHPNVVMSEWVKIGIGSVITVGCTLTCNIKIGQHAQLNPNTTIGHDCIIGDFFTAAPAANISGSCNIGDCVYFGTNTAVKQGISICENVTIGMGGVVVKSITEPGVYIGCPVIKMNK